MLTRLPMHAMVCTVHSASCEVNTRFTLQRCKKQPPRHTTRPRDTPSDHRKHKSPCTGAQRFPANNFTYCLTLSPEYFSTFPYGTCSLSVSRQYLAVDGVYHPPWNAVPHIPTLRHRTVRWRTHFTLARSYTGLSPTMAACSKAL